MRHTPMERFGWEQIIRRAELSSTTKLVALALATFANPNGGRVRPGERLLADCCGHKERAIREHLAVLRKAGLIECVFEASRGRAAVYQLTIPGVGFDPVPMRLDPDGDLLAERPVGRRGSRREMTGTGAPVDNEMTGSPVPVNGSVDRHPGAADPGNDRHPDAQSPAPGCSMTGTPTHDDRHPGAAHHTDHTNQPRPTVGALGEYLTYAEPNNAPEDDSSPAPGNGYDWVAPQTEYAVARRTVDNSPYRDAALTEARMYLAAEGRDRPEMREVILTAAEILAAQTSGEEPA